MMMNDAISRNALLEILGMTDFAEYIRQAPAINHVKHGEWIEIQYGVLVCSECKKQSLKFNYYKNNIPTKYCPHCGARMDGEDDDE